MCNKGSSNIFHGKHPLRISPCLLPARHMLNSAYMTCIVHDSYCFSVILTLLLCDFDFLHCRFLACKGLRELLQGVNRQCCELAGLRHLGTGSLDRA